MFELAETTGVHGSFTRVDATHPLGLFVGLDAGRRCILAVCPRRPPEPPAIGALHIDVRPRTTGEWALTIRLARPDLSGLFTRLVEDLATSTLRSPGEPGQTIIDRLTRWQRMLARGPSALLEDIELRGLVAEVSFLLEEAAPYVGVERAVTAWVGPFDAPKDFVFPDREVEIKATTRQPRALLISSLEQLTDGGVPLYLWTRAVEVEHARPDPTRSVSSWVRRARATVATSPTSASQLEDALRAAGWEDRDEYEAWIVRAGPVACYRVQGAFPRIQRPYVPAGVMDARYRLDVSSLAPFVTLDWKGA